jgi:hypothetical protein
MTSEDKYLEWKKRVFILDLAEIRLKKSLEQGKISKRKYNKLKRMLGKEWLKNWDYYPDKNPSVEQAFKINFL